LAAGATFAGVAFACASTEWPTVAGKVLTDTSEGTVQRIGISLLSDYLIPFEFASILLLVVLVGSARMARGGTR
jgi:NADH-quinone oxidoreductase subunit J